VIAALPATVYRVTRAAFAGTVEDALSGAGGLYDDGRWHRRGSHILYTSESTTLSMYERLVHADELFSERRTDRVMLAIALPRVSTMVLTEAEVAAGDPHWRCEGSLFCRAFGDRWLVSRASCALIVPSAADPNAANILLNPEHTEYRQIVAANCAMVSQDLEPDPRLAPMVQAHRRAAGA